MIRSFLLALVLLAASCAQHPRGMQPPQPERDLAKATQLLAQADALRNDGKHPAAIEKYKQALLLRDDLPSAWNNVGVCLMAQNNYFEAQQAFIRAAELSPHDPRPYENVGLLYQNRFQDELALEYFQKSIDRAPNYLPAIRGAVKSASRLGRSDERLRDVVRRGLLLEKDPDWLRIMEHQRIRVEQDLAQERARGPAS